MLYHEEYNSPKPNRYMNINISLIYKILFSNAHLKIIFYCENLMYVKRLSDLMRETGLWWDVRYSCGNVEFNNNRIKIKFLVPTKNFKGFRPDLSFVIGDFNEEVMDRIYPCATSGMIWFKDSKEFIEHFENFKKQDKIKLKFENGKGYEVQEENNE